MNEKKNSKNSASYIQNNKYSWTITVLSSGTRMWELFLLLFLGGKIQELYSSLFYTLIDELCFNLYCVYMCPDLF